MHFIFLHNSRMPKFHAKNQKLKKLDLSIHYTTQMQKINPVSLKTSLD